MAWVGVIDAGGSKTIGAMAHRDGRVQLTTQLGGANPQDCPDWRDVLTQIAQQLAPADLIVTGVAGVGELPGVDDQIRALFAARAGIHPLNDAELALQAAFPLGDGTLLVAGTGSIAMSKGPRGLHRTGGWGPLFGDEGSAQWIGRAALGLASRQIDGRSADTGFARHLMAHLNCDADRPFALLEWAREKPRTQIARLARFVDDRAQQRDPAAITLLTEAAGHLCAHVRTAADLAGLTRPLVWSGAGSVLNSATIMHALTRDLGPPLAHRPTPLAGGLTYAARLAGWTVSPDWIETITRNLAHAQSLAQPD